MIINLITKKYEKNLQFNNQLQESHSVATHKDLILERIADDRYL